MIIAIFCILTCKIIEAFPTRSHLIQDTMKSQKDVDSFYLLMSFIQRLVKKSLAVSNQETLFKLQEQQNFRLNSHGHFNMFPEYSNHEESYYHEELSFKVHLVKMERTLRIKLGNTMNVTFLEFTLSYTSGFNCIDSEIDTLLA